ncbi:YheC/YheD family protein [Paenibacillus harenae]|uniref:YheC/YheD family endospore coat-associated protein n=1 Tax=Paenibacillus harenae TaxID=306543 RepID=UPI00041B0C89|nr:YheC/YheD family protein [Paenibacillus harenae]
MQIRTIILGIVVAAIRPPGSDHGLKVEASALPEPRFCRALSLAAGPLGIDVYVFAADGYHAESGTLHAYRYQHNGWSRQAAPLPDIVYDRCFYTETAQRISCLRMLDSMSARKPHVLLNGSLPAKLAVYASLKDDPMLKEHLPESESCESAEQLLKLLPRHKRGIVLKPSAGMQGRGLMHIKRCPHNLSLLVRGRTGRNRHFSRTFADDRTFAGWIESRITRHSYFIQPYLELSGEDGKPFDVRVLMQKDGTGRWASSGTAVRCGQAGSLTSNLHGGGGAGRADSLLAAKFGKIESERLIEQIHTISKQTAERLESRFGRFAELGLDYGIEPDGRLWLLEANSKPGRSAFRSISDKKAEMLSIERPLLYARFLSNRLYPSFAANESVNGRQSDVKITNPIRPFNVQEVHR